MKIRRISQSDWDLIYPALEHLSIKTIKTARDILVDGKKPSDVSKERNVTRQNVHAAVKKVTTIIDEQEIKGLQAVNVWLPPDLAEQVIEIAKHYMKQTK
ncbi:TrfB-related DNA-binding protein [Photorhabdus aballayi]|uniref:TrfB-related DNA-binding protein n=1 Tax=Photorhabdus TaxID=29487 RepID=UPI00223CA85D|nr:TrfB-related DNA-binding protein [Photorhabdus aballayi]MCW7549995.1 transcriptional regulator KorA [Photorhabdus aballayi]